MDDIIVIILTLIFIVASIFGQMKKRQAANQPQPESQPKEDDFWELLKEGWDETGKPEVKAQSAGEKLSEVPVQQKEYKFKAENEGERLIQKSSVKNVRNFDRQKETKKSKFPLKEAVIYSEILNRKYF